MTYQSSQADPTIAVGSSSSDSKLKPLPLILAFLAVVCFILCASSSPTKESIWTAALLSLPVIAQVIGAIILWNRVNNNGGNFAYYKFNLLATFTCTVSYCALWWLYSKQSPEFAPNRFQLNSTMLQFLSLVALAFIGVLLGFVGIMTAAFMMASRENRATRWVARECKALREGIRQEPLWAVALFFILFLDVAYLFGFALAFHDQYALASDKAKRINPPRPALRMVNAATIDDGEPSADPQNLSAKPGSNSSDSQIGIKDAENGGTFCFYFNEGEAHLRSESYEKCTGVAPPERTDANLRKPEQYNDCSLKALLHRIQKATDGDQHIRVLLIGHTSNEPIKPDSISQNFVSNYELSQARAETVRFEVSELFDEKNHWKNVEWSILPASNAPLKEIASGLSTKELFTANELRERLGIKDLRSITQANIEERFSSEEILKKLTPNEQRVVLAVVEPIRDHVSSMQMEEIRKNQSKSQFKGLGLMDYMYFSVYTITTTGYGDIIPTTAYAKFVTSLANVCEVLFLVVFFNALISIKGDRPPPDSKTLVGSINEPKHPESGGSDKSLHQIRDIGRRKLGEPTG